MAEWYEALDADTKTHIAAKGWDKLDPAAAAIAASRAHQGAEKLIGHPADQILRLPKDAADPTYQSIYDRVVGMSAPKTPEEYKFDGIKHGNGADLAADDAAFVRELATKYKLPVAAARGIAEGVAARADGEAGKVAAAAATAKAANSAYLMAQWGPQYDQRSFSAIRAAEAANLPKSILDHIATLPPEEYRHGMDALVALGERMGEAAMLRGGGMRGDGVAGLSPADAQKRLDMRMEDKTWVQKFHAHDTDTLDEWRQLCTLIASGRVPQR